MKGFRRSILSNIVTCLLVIKRHAKLISFFLILLLVSACGKTDAPERIDLSTEWRFSGDESNIGQSEKWYAPGFDDSQWAKIDAGKRWEDLGYPDLDGYGWYRKKVDVPAGWTGESVWIKFNGVNDAYELFINGTSVSFFGEANISFASKPTFSEISKHLKTGETNHIAVKVNDWGNSGGLWRSPIILTTDENEVKNILGPMTDTQYTPESLGYELFWEDQFEGNELDPDKWAVRGVGPRAAGYVSPEAVKVKGGYPGIIGP